MKFTHQRAFQTLLVVGIISIMGIGAPKAEAFSFSSLFSSVSSFFKQTQTPEEIQQKQILNLIAHSNNIVTQLSDRTSVLDGIADTIATSMSQMTAKGQDVQAAQTSFDEATSTLSAIRNTIAQATTTIDSALQDLTAVNLKDINNSLESIFQTAESQIKTAHQDLLDTTRTLQDILNTLPSDSSGTSTNPS